MSFLEKDQFLIKILKNFYESTYFELMETTPFNQLNEKAGEYIWDDLISDAFTSDVVFNNPKEEAIEYIINICQITVGFSQS